MKGINLGRVILGGLLAGVINNASEFVLNTVVFKAEMEAAMKALGKSVPMTTQSIVVWVLYGFVVGIVSVWLYAAVRPRYGAGAGTAIRVGLVMWMLMSLMFSVAMWNMGLFEIMPVILVWELVQIVVATVAGAALYKEAA